MWVIGALEEFAFTSYYSSMHKSAMSNNNPNLYRPYDIESTHSSNISKVTNGVGVVHSTGSLGNRNMLGNSSSYFALADLNEKTSAAAWPHFPDTSSYSHQRSQQSTSPDVIHQAAPIPPTFSSDLFLSQQNYQHQPFASVSSSNESHHQQQQHQLPIRPIPRQASVLHRTQNYPFIFPECGRYCPSSGVGLKREFCHVVRAKVDNKNNNANHADKTIESESTFHYPYYHVDSGPLNLSTDDKIARASPQAAVDSIRCEPINFRTNDLFAGSPSLSEENINSVIRSSQSISANPTVLATAMPTLVPTIWPIPIVQDGLPNITSQSVVVRGRDRKCCPHCPAVILRSERALVKHLLSHNNLYLVRQPYECKSCGSRFSRKFHMTRHMKQRGCDGTPQSQFNCEFCGKHFSRKDNMREHVKGHTGQTKKKVNKLPCPVPRCEKTFSGNTQLQAHLNNVHSDLRPYNCSLDDCNRTFRSSGALKRHMHIHNQGNRFQCPQCDARFGTKHSLDRHVKIHAAGKRSIKSYESQRCGVCL